VTAHDPLHPVVEWTEAEMQRLPPEIQDVLRRIDATYNLTTCRWTNPTTGATFTTHTLLRKGIAPWL